MKKQTLSIIHCIKIFCIFIIVTFCILFLLLFLSGPHAHPINVAIILSAIFCFVGFYLAFFYIYKPFMANEKVKMRFSQGTVYYDIFQLPYYFNAVEADMLRHFLEMLDNQNLINVSKKEAEYLALQNQINPHFLYNTLDGIRSEALMLGADNIAEMTEALSTYFSYTISQTDNLVTLEDELANIENYYYIQQFRFGDHLDLSIEYNHSAYFEEDSILSFRLPKLSLQPIVENAICHGIETKIGKGHLKIHITATSEHLIIKISDDGVGIAPEQLSQLNKRFQSLTLDNSSNQKKKGGIAIQNVNNRIKLLFGERYGIYIYSHEGTGTDVELTLPIILGNEMEQS